MKITHFLHCLSGLMLISFIHNNIIGKPYQMGRYESSYNMISKIKSEPVKQVQMPQKQNNIIFDVGGVLLEVSKFRAFRKLGMSCIFHTDIGDRFMEFITFIEPEIECFSKENQPKYLDRNLPPLMCKWQKGEFTCKEFVDKIKDQADKNPKFFKSKSEKNLIKKSADLLLPENHINIEKIKSSGLKLLKKLKDKKDKQGNPVNNLFIISNFDDETFTLLQKKFPELFGLFNPEQIIVSARVKMIKPHKNIFEHTSNKFQLDPKSCIFIDDQLENVKGAESCGMAAIHHTSSKNTNNRLKSLGIL
ncbi:MAG: HAD-IA family hydrolase [Candidatus Babeliales bacterium]|nr:HAD-IA family hydrolase [Candidatus Babeliales bacterium]